MAEAQLYEDKVRAENEKICKQEFYSALGKGTAIGSGISALANVLLHNTCKFRLNELTI